MLPFGNYTTNLFLLYSEKWLEQCLVLASQWKNRRKCGQEILFQGLVVVTKRPQIGKVGAIDVHRSLVL